MFFALRSTLPATDGKELPKRLLVAKWGRNEAPSKGVTFFVNETTVRELPKNQLAVGFDKPALDFEHNTLPGTDAFKADKEPRNIAATGAFSVVPGEGLYFTPSRWTPEGEKSVLGGHHPDISPALKFNDKAEVILAHSVALCRNGSVPDLQVFSIDGELGEKVAALSVTPISTAMNHKELLCLILGLSATANDIEIATAAKTFATNAATSAQGVQAFTTQLKSATDSVAAVLKRLDDQDRANITALAIRDGKIIPLSANKMAIEDFRALVAELPANQVPMDQRTVEGIKAFSSSGVMTSAAKESDEAVRKQLGISEADWKK
jgi:phage I-like protein